MGLEITETVLSVEEAFGITIADDCIDLRTVGDLYYLVLRQLDEGDKYHCFTPYAFMKFRRPLQTLTGRPKAEIRPDTPLAELFPWRSRRRKWKALASESGLRVPALETVIPGCLIGLVTILGGLALGIGTAALGFAHLGRSRPPEWLGVPMLSLIVLGTPIGLAMGTQALLRFRFPGRAVTVLDLIDVMRKQSYGYATSSGNLVSSGDVWLTIRSIVSKSSGVAPELVTPDAYLNEDLGMG